MSDPTGATHRHTVYVVVPLGDAGEQATDSELADVQLALLPFVTHAVTDPRVCGDLTAHLLARTLNRV